MAAFPEGLPPAVTDNVAAPLGLRPVTLLVASGIALISALLILTGLAAGRLRAETLSNRQGELSRLGLVLAEQGNRSFARVDRLLRSVADRIRDRDVASEDVFVRMMAAPEIHRMLRDEASGAAAPDSLVVVGTDGRVVATSRDGALPTRNFAHRDFFQVLASSQRDGIEIGAPFQEMPIPSHAAAAWVIPAARRLTGPNGKLLGVVLAEIPIDAFSSFYRTVPLGAEGAITLLRCDGRVLARAPEEPAALGRLVADSAIRGALAHGGGTLTLAGAQQGEWRIASIAAMRDYPLAVLVTARGDRVLIGWFHQAVLFSGFALIGAVLIGAMVVLIARQFHTHAALAAVRIENIEMERARIEAEAELLKRDRLSVLGQLTATVAHELRNPLSAIRNTLFSIKEQAGRNGLKLDRPVSRIERSIERCDRIISDLLEYTKTREIRRVAVGFDAWLDDVLAEQNLAPDMALVKDLRAADVMVPIDADRMRRVLINLIDNAAQALSGEPGGSAEKRIAIRSETSGGMLVLIIEDNGPGISPEHLARVFEPLFSTKTTGTGLGLATVKQIVIQHDGVIDIESEPGEGTRVIIRLPLDTAVRAAA